MQRSTLGVWLAAVVLLSACASSPDSTEPDRSLSADALYEAARDALKRGDTAAALVSLETLQVRYPQDPHAVQAQLDIILAYYQREDYDFAITAAEQFRKFNPGSPHGAYALYMVGRSEAAKLDGLFDLYVPRDFADYDQRVQTAALQAFQGVFRQYPNSPWADDARDRSNEIVETSARHELKTAQYYFDRGAYVGAVNRVSALLSLYPDSAYTVDGLVILHDSYRAQGLGEQADAVRALIATADPDHSLASD
ncbi:MAG: outer membrane protein assembly factor BamD [Pseudomonadota bacterium]